jgi:hypothetical protein
MRNLMIAFLMMIGLTSVEAQISFEGKKLITIKDEGRKVENIDSRIIINSDTTEIEVFLGVAHFKETIGEFYSSFGDEGYKILVYKLKNDELLILHFNEGILFSVVFQTDMINKLEFEI